MLSEFDLYDYSNIERFMKLDPAKMPDNLKRRKGSKLKAGVFYSLGSKINRENKAKFGKANFKP